MIETNRINFLDNIRTLIVILVIIFHSAIAYSVFDSWWYIHDKNTNIIFDIFITALDIFMMPTLFFISGYFAIPSIDSISIKEFLKKKFIRLGLPWVVCIIFYIPLLDLITNYNKSIINNISPSRFDTIFITHIKNIAFFNIGPVISNQEHLWFISLLLFFFLFFALYYKYKDKISIKFNASNNISQSKLMIILLILIGLFNTLWHLSRLNETRRFFLKNF